MIIFEKLNPPANCTAAIKREVKVKSFEKLKKTGDEVLSDAVQSNGNPVFRCPKLYTRYVLPYRFDRDISANRLSYHGKHNRKPCRRWQPLKTIALTSPYEAFACVCERYRFKKSCVRFC